MDFLVTSLRQIGLSLNEAKCYLGLLRRRGVTGYELDKNAGTLPSRIYESLAKLRARGFVGLIQSTSKLLGRGTARLTCPLGLSDRIYSSQRL